MRQPTDEEIRERAYRLWDAAGRPEEREQEFWYQAERELSGETGQTWATNPDEKSSTFLE